MKMPNEDAGNTAGDATLVSDVDLDLDFDAESDSAQSEGGEAAPEVDPDAGEAGAPEVDPDGVAAAGKDKPDPAKPPAAEVTERLAKRASELRERKREELLEKSAAAAEALAGKGKETPASGAGGEAAGGATELDTVIRTAFEGLKLPGAVDGETISYAELTEEYPAVSMLLEKGVAAAVDAVIKPLQAKLAAAEAEIGKVKEFRDQQEESAARAELYEKIGTAANISNVGKIVESREFQSWFNALPETMKALGMTGDVEDYAALIQDYQEIQSKREAARAARDKRSGVLRATPRTRVPSPSNRDLSEDDLDAEFNKEAEL